LAAGWALGGRKGRVGLLGGIALRQNRLIGIRINHLQVARILSGNRLGVQVAAVKFRHPVVFELDCQGAPFHLAAAPGEGIDVVPAICMEWVAHCRRTQQQFNLALGHADLKLGEVFLVDHVALLNVLLVHDIAAGQGDEQGECKNSEHGLASGGSG